MNTGKLVTIGILVIAALMAGVAWWNTWHKGRHALAYWGSENAYQIRLAERVTLFQLADSTDTDPVSELVLGPGLILAIHSQRDISQARGLVHARQALIQDTSFNWPEVALANPKWEYAIGFGEGDSRALVLCDLSQGIISRAGAGKTLSTNLGPGLKTLFDEQLPPERSGPE